MLTSLDIADLTQIQEKKTDNRLHVWNIMNNITTQEGTLSTGRAECHNLRPLSESHNLMIPSADVIIQWPQPPPI